MSNMMNDAYRKSRGTDKPFSGSEEQAKGIWQKLIRKTKPQYGKSGSTPEATSKA